MRHSSHELDPVFAPRGGTLAARIGERMRDHRPIVAAIAVWLVSFVLLAGVIIGLGLLLTHVLSPAGGAGSTRP